MGLGRMRSVGNETKTPGVLLLKTRMNRSDHVSAERCSGLSAEGEDLASAESSVEQGREKCGAERMSS